MLDASISEAIGGRNALFSGSLAGCDTGSSACLTIRHGYTVRGLDVQSHGCSRARFSILIYVFLIRQDLAGEQDLIYNLIKRSGATEVFIIHFTVLGGEDADKIVSLPLEFTDCLRD